MREAGIEPTIIASDDAVVGAAPLVHAKSTVIKVHSATSTPASRTRTPNWRHILRAMNNLLDQVFDNFGLLVVGWSGEWDAAVRDAILRAPARQYPLYWAARGGAGRWQRSSRRSEAGEAFRLRTRTAFS